MKPAAGGLDHAAHDDMPGTPRLLLALLLALSVTPAALAAQRATPWCFTGFHPGEVHGTVFLPEGDLFCPLIADPKTEHPFASYLRGNFPAPGAGAGADDRISIASIGLADGFPLVRFAGGAPGNGVQFGVVGGIFAQFDLDTPSFDLINADYMLGLPLTVRHGGFSTRLRVYHQSSHLGDEYLLSTDVQRENLSFEALELLLSQEVGPIRAYGGGEYLLRRDPDTLERTVAHGGLELRLGPLTGTRAVAAVDAKATKQHDWQPGWSARAGVEFAHAPGEGHPPRLWGLLAEYYDGPSPYGQFFQEHVHWIGVGLHLSM